jgi:CHASE3 domain sensor protein
VTPSTLRRRLANAFVALAAVIVVGLAVAGIAAVQLHDAQSRVIDRLFRAYSLAGDLNQSVVDQEAGFRGYALTGDEEFLAPYLTGRERAAAVTARLGDIESDFPELRKHRLALQDRVNRWQTTVVDPAVAAVRADRAVGEETLRSGSTQFDRIRADIRAYRGEILERRRASVSELRRDNIVLFCVIGLGVVLLVTASALLWLALRRWVT